MNEPEINEMTAGGMGKSNHVGNCCRRFDVDAARAAGS